MSEESCDLHDMFHVIEGVLNSTHLALKFVMDRLAAGGTLTPNEIATVAFIVDGADRLSGEATTMSADLLMRNMHDHMQARH